MSIKTIFIDFGGVIVKTPNQNAIQRWKKILGWQDSPEIDQMLAEPNESPLIKEICLGNLPEDALWEKMAEDWGVRSVLIKKLKQRMRSKQNLNEALLKFVASLRSDYQTAILSNAGDQTRQLMEAHYHLDNYVDEIIISAEEGVIKPDPKIFEIAMQRLNTTPERSLLLDDYEENVLAARQFGMQAVQFIDTQQAIREVADLLNHKE